MTKIIRPSNPNRVLQQSLKRFLPKAIRPASNEGQLYYAWKNGAVYLIPKGSQPHLHKATTYDDGTHFPARYIQPILQVTGITRKNLKEQLPNIDQWSFEPSQLFPSKRLRNAHSKIRGLVLTPEQVQQAKQQAKPDRTTPAGALTAVFMHMAKFPPL